MIVLILICYTYSRVCRYSRVATQSVLPQTEMSRQPRLPVPVMLDKRGLGAEALAAVDALERLLPGVDPHVDVEQGDVGEPLGAESALVLKCLHRLVATPVYTLVGYRYHFKKIGTRKNK